MGLLILTLIIALTTAVFALQNTDVVTIQFLLWEYQTSLVLVILGSVASGVVVTLLASVGPRWKGTRHLRSLETTVKSQDTRIRELEESQRLSRESSPPTGSPPPAST